ncbi:MAG: thiamine-phosphate kinase [Kaiparowitsia implicata GSE-PSE-MK54-09C]|jgi:thiamine-monophosphate kinase|nr:thiamine-phosphate kinase [Kaiparowitsia implicata GSE-PSE-MK54-09C]
MHDKPLHVADVGEQGLLRRLLRFCDGAVVGDDAAVLSMTPGRSLVVTEDMLVDGVHFSVGLANPAALTTSYADAGWRAVAANLSDLAAMGATPLGITVGLGVPAQMPVSGVEALYEGMVACLQTAGAAIVGGDVCRSDTLTVAIAAFGEVIPSQVVRRASAQPGDAILVTGVHGASRAGLELLLQPDCGKTLSESDRALLIRAHQRPMPRLDVVQLWRQHYPDARVPAGMDSSDGLADAILQICRASGVGAQVWGDRLPMPAVFPSWLTPEVALDWTLYGGEDFELVLCLPKESADALQMHLPSAALVGEVVAGDAVRLVDAHGDETTLSMARGFQHF